MLRAAPQPRQTDRKVNARWITVLRFCITTLVAVLAVACSICAYRIHALNRSVDRSRLPVLAASDLGRSILVVSPHPDDETLGAAGLLQTAVASGRDVHVVFMTSGDAFKFGIGQYYKKVDVGPEDCKNYGVMRMKESVQALESLGLKRDQVLFFGFPDRGMMAMWRSFWNPDQPFISPYSRTDHVVYSNVYAPGAVYCGRSVLNNLLSLMRRIKPTDVYVTHPNDDHDDHSASSAFTTLAVAILKHSGEPWTRNLHIHYYLVHRGDWPVPQGYHPDVPLAPPAQLLNCDTDWSRLPLTAQEETRKHEAIAQYHSQEAMMARFLSSFVRRNEVFGDIPAQSEFMSSEPSGVFDIRTSTAPWPNVRPVSIDPTGDNILLALQKGADIAKLEAYHDSQYLYVRLDANGSLVPDTHYTLHIRAVDLEGNSPDQETAVQVTPAAYEDGKLTRQPGGVTASWRGEYVEVKAPLSQLKAPRDGLIFIEGVSRFSKILFDRTGPRAIRIRLGAPAPAPAPLS